MKCLTNVCKERLIKSVLRLLTREIWWSMVYIVYQLLMVFMYKYLFWFDIHIRCLNFPWIKICFYEDISINILLAKHSTLLRIRRNEDCYNHFECAPGKVHMHTIESQEMMHYKECFSK